MVSKDLGSTHPGHSGTAPLPRPPLTMKDEPFIFALTGQAEGLHQLHLGGHRAGVTWGGCETSLRPWQTYSKGVLLHVRRAERPARTGRPTAGGRRPVAGPASPQPRPLLRTKPLPKGSESAGSQSRLRWREARSPKASPTLKGKGPTPATRQGTGTMEPTPLEAQLQPTAASQPCRGPTLPPGQDRPELTHPLP